MKNLLQGFKSRFEQLEEKISKLKNSSIELIQSVEQKVKRMEKMNTA